MSKLILPELLAIAVLFGCLIFLFLGAKSLAPCKPDQSPVFDATLCITQVAGKGEPIIFNTGLKGEWKIVQTVEGQMLLVEDCE